MDHQEEANALSEVLAITQGHYRRIGEVYGKGRQYGALCVRGFAHLQSPTYSAVPFGKVPVGEKTRCFQLAQEKAARLLKNPNHVSSWQSRNPDSERYGGAISLPPEESPVIGILSWSSFPELVDEAFMLAVAIRAGLLSERSARAIAKLSGAPLDNILNLMYENQ